MSKTPTNIPPRGRGNPPRKAGAASRSAVSPRPGRARPQRRSRRGGSRRGLVYGGGAAVLVAGVAALVAVLLIGGGGGTGTVKTSQAAVDYKLADGTRVYAGLGPEGIPLEVGPPLAQASIGLNGTPRAGVQCNTTEQLAYHHHVHVVIFIHGKPMSIPIGVGIVPPAEVEHIANGAESGYFVVGSGGPNGGCFYWIHTHSNDGIFHLESPEPKPFELGQAFGVWNVALSSSRIGPYSGGVTATVNGQPWLGDPAQIPLLEREQIVLNLGTPVITPPPISWAGTHL